MLVMLFEPQTGTFFFGGCAFSLSVGSVGTVHIQWLLQYIDWDLDETGICLNFFARVTIILAHQSSNQVLNHDASKDKLLGIQQSWSWFCQWQMFANSFVVSWLVMNFADFAVWVLVEMFCNQNRIFGFRGKNGNDQVLRKGCIGIWDLSRDKST